MSSPQNVSADGQDIKMTTISKESKPLIENLNPQLPPIAGPEIDDLDDRQTVRAPYPGIDSGFFATDQPDLGKKVPVFPQNGFSPRPARPFSPFPSAPGFVPYDGRSEFDVSGIPTDLESLPDVNIYQHKKTLAQGMMDLALFSANANQLRYVVESFDRHPYYYPSVILISLSLLMQVAIGVGLIWNSRYNVKDQKEICVANKINNYTVIGIFLVTTINVFISAFGVASGPPPVSVMIGGRLGEDDNTTMTTLPTMLP